MIAGIALDTFWREVAAHLWQTTLVLLALVLIARTMRNAPARLLNSLWWIGFAKIFMPLALLGHVGRLLVYWLAGASADVYVFPRIFAALAGGAYYIMEPGLLVVGAAPGGEAPVHPVFIVITVLWATGAAFMLIRWTRTAVTRRLPSGRPLPRCGEDIRLRLETAAREGAIDPANVRVLEGGGVPAVAGVLRPRIVIPEQSTREMDPDELRAVLLHEEAHRRRYEPLRLALQRFALTVFFFYPPLWLLLKELNSSAEMACDEAVMETGTGAGTYASAIARMLGLGFEESPAVSMLGFGSASSIQVRLDRLEKNRRYVAMNRHRLAISAAVLMVVLLSFVPLAPLADSQPVGDSEPAVPAPPAPPAAPLEPEVVQTAPRLIADEVLLPEYPENAREAGIEGEVLLDVFINDDGSVRDVKVAEGIAGYPELGESAIEAVKEWTFVPATLDGEPVEAEVLVPVAFSLDGSKPAEITEPPALIDDLCPLPEYPEAARKAGAEGRVFLEVTVKADGTVTGVKVREGIPEHPELDQAALESVMQWKFKPATSGGVPVDMDIVIPVEFRMDKSKTGK